MALRNPCFKDQNWSHLREPVEREREEQRREEEEEEEGVIKQAKVWKLTLFMNPMRLSMNFHALMVILLPKSRVFTRVSS